MHSMKSGYLLLGVVFVSMSMKCPKNIFQWNSRAENFNCTNGEVYHCALDQHNRPIEVCYERSIIAPNDEGCPFFQRGDGKVGLGYPIRKCEPKIKGCPPSNHSGYYLDMLYLYPSCFEGNLSTTLTTKKITHKEMAINKSRTSECGVITCPVLRDVNLPTNFLIIVSVFLVIAVAVIVGLLWYIRRIRQQQAFSTPMDPCNRDTNSEEGRPLVTYENTFSTPIDPCNRDTNSEEGRPLVTFENRRPEEIGIQRPTGRTSSWIIDRKEMKDLQEKLSSNQTVFLIGDWGNGKSTIVKWYINRISSDKKEVAFFNCTDKLTFIESLKEWQTKVKKALSAKVNFTTPGFKNSRLSKIVRETVQQIHSFGSHDIIILVFDDVGKECKCIFDELVENKKTKEMKDVKYIATCHENKWPRKEEHIIRIPGFDQACAMKFMEECADHKECLEISKILKYSPIALHCAKMYIMNTNITSEYALKYFKSINNSENSPLIFILELLQCVHPLTFEILKCLQFIRCNDIPIILFRFLQVPTWKNKIIVDTFVMNARSCSFITVTGYDLHRVVNIHHDVFLRLQQTTDTKSKSKYLKAILNCFSSMFSKRPCPPVTRERYVQLLPHAKKILESSYSLLNTDDSLLDDADFIILTLVYDRVIYTMNSFGMIKNAKDLTKSFLNICRFFPEGKNVDPERSARVTYDKYTESFDTSAMATKLRDTASNFVLNKARGERNLSCLIIEGQTSDDKYQLQPDEYARLVREGKAVELAHTGKWLYLQAHINMALTLGLKSADQTCNLFVSTDEDDLRYVQYASFLAKLLVETEEFQGFHFYSVLDAEINGEVELFINDARGKHKDINKVIERVEEILGIIKRHGYCVACANVLYDNDMCIFICAMKQRIRLYAKKGCFDEAGHISEELRIYLAERKAFLRESFISQTAKQCIVKYFIEQQRYKDALDTLAELSSFDILRDDDHILTIYDIVDIELKCKCLKFARKDSELEDTLKNIDSLLSKMIHVERDLYSNLSCIKDKYSQDDKD